MHEKLKLCASNGCLSLYGFRTQKNTDDSYEDHRCRRTAVSVPPLGQEVKRQRDKEEEEEEQRPLNVTAPQKDLFRDTMITSYVTYVSRFSTVVCSCRQTKQARAASNPRRRESSEIQK